MSYAFGFRVRSEVLKQWTQGGAAFRATVDDSGTVLLTLWESKRAEIAAEGTGNFGDTVLQRIAEIEADGLEEPTVESFNTFKSALDHQIKTLPDDLALGLGHLQPSLRRARRAACRRLTRRSCRTSRRGAAAGARRGLACRSRRATRRAA